MKVARYLGQGEVAIVDEPMPECPKGGLLVQTEACGLCSGELMTWYMDRKIPHVLGHEVAGIVRVSDDLRFPVGSRVFPHHHAPCLHCQFCQAGQFVHCVQWKRTKLVPGGMAQFFAVDAENLTDTLIVDDLRPRDAALIEPLACVVKSLRMAGPGQAAVIGLGVMGLMHLALLDDAVGYDLSEVRRLGAEAQGFRTGPIESPVSAEVVFVCPGNQSAFDFAMKIVQPGGTVVMFAPLPPGEALQVPQRAYFQDLRIVQSYSCGPDDTRDAANHLRRLAPFAERVVSDFIAIEDLPQAYANMKSGRILKAMVEFPRPATGETMTEPPRSSA